MNTILSEHDKINGEFRYNIIGLEETFILNVKVNPETYLVEGAIHSVIQRGSDNHVSGNAMIEDDIYVIQPQLIEGITAMNDSYIIAKKYLHMNRDKYMTNSSIEFDNLLLSHMMYIEKKFVERQEERDVNKSKNILSNFTKIFKG